jgi:hypothetical protein
MSMQMQEKTQMNGKAREPLYIRMRDEDNVAIVANRGGLHPGAVFADGQRELGQGIAGADAGGAVA